MVFFKNEIVTKVTIEKIKNKIGQEIEIYKKSSEKVPCNIQPIEEKAYKYTWGEHIESHLEMFIELELNVGDPFIIGDNRVYEVESKKNWWPRLYAIKESDKEVLENENS